MSSLEDRVKALEVAVAQMRARAPVAPVNLDADKFADFAVRKSPPKWLDSGGRDYGGENISKTTPEFCDAMADFLDWQASKDEEKNYSYVNGKGKTVFPAEYARKDAARARAWAVKLRATPQQQWKPPATAGRLAPPPAQDDFNYGANAGDDEIPF
jgi:hypothetical protein